MFGEVLAGHRQSTPDGIKVKGTVILYTALRRRRRGANKTDWMMDGWVGIS